MTNPNQLAPEKCPSCGATDNTPYETEYGVKMRACGRCMIQWVAAGRDALPVEPQTYEHHVYCSALRTTPRGAVGKGCSCDVIEKSLAKAVETVPVVQPQSRSIQHSEGNKGGAPSFCAGNREPEPVKDGYSPAQTSGVVPQGVERDWADVWAQDFHDTYERSAPAFGYETRRESAKPWAEVPKNNRKLMTAVVAEVLCRFLKSRQAHAAASQAEVAHFAKQNLEWAITAERHMNENVELKAKIAAQARHFEHKLAAYLDRIKKAERERDQAREALRWIPVSERLPAWPEYVWMTWGTKESMKIGCYYRGPYSKAGADAKGWCDVNGWMNHNSPPTHWMAVPPSEDAPQHRSLEYEG